MPKMKTLEELLSELKQLGRDIRNVQRACGYDECSDLSCLDIPMQDAEGLFLWDELYGVMDKLADAQAGIDYLSRPVQAEGVLRKGRNEHYYLNNVEFTCGSPVEILVEDDCRDVPYWRSGRLEHDGKRYYFTGAKQMSLQGARARIR